MNVSATPCHRWKSLPRALPVSGPPPGSLAAAPSSILPPERGAGRGLPLRIWAAPGIRAYLPPHPALSLADSFLCSYALLILSPRFCPDPAEESGKRDPLPHMRDFLHRVGLSEPPWRLSPAQKASICLCRSGGPRVWRLRGRWNSFDKQNSIYMYPECYRPGGS